MPTAGWHTKHAVVFAVLLLRLHATWCALYQLKAVEQSMGRQPRVSLVRAVYALSCAVFSRAQNNATASNVGQPDWKPGHPVYIQAPLPDNGAGCAPAVGYTCDHMHSSLGPILLCYFAATQSYNAMDLGAIEVAMCLQITNCTSFFTTFTRSLGACCGCGLFVPLGSLLSRVRIRKKLQSRWCARPSQLL